MPRLPALALLTLIASALPLHAQPAQTTQPATTNQTQITLETRADSEFTRRDCTAAEASYLEAIHLAQLAADPNRTGLYYRRIGICRARAGNLPGALEAYRTGILITEASGDRELLAENVHGAALALQKLGNLPEAMQLAQRELAIMQQYGTPANLVRAMWLMADLDDATGKMRAGLQLLEQALALNRTTTDKQGRLILLDNLAVRYASLGDYDSALHMQNEILATADPTNLPGVAINYNNIGETMLKAGHPDEARQWYEKAVAASTAPDAWRVHVGALFNVGEMRSHTGQSASADEAFAQALALVRQYKVPDLESIGLRMQSDSLLSRGNSAEAATVAEHAVALARQIASPGRTYEGLLALGSAHAAAGDQPAARACFDEALGLAETLRAQSAGEASDLRGAFANLIPLYQASVENLLALNLPTQALDRAEQAKARVLMDILLRGGVDERAAMSQTEIADLAALRARMGKAGDALALQDATRDFRQFRRTIYANHPELAVQSADFEPASLDKLAALLPDRNTALLDYFIVPSGVALFVIRGPEPKVSAFLLPDPKHTSATQASAFRTQLADRELGYKTLARQLFTRLLAPAMQSLSGSTKWIVSPDGPLWDIPFEALVDTSDRHIIETRSVAVEPSLTAALNIHDRPQSTTTGGIRLLALGNPLPRTAALPDAAREVTEIGNNYAPTARTILTGTSATANAFRKQAPSAGIIHLAAHAGLNNNDPLSSWVQLGSDTTEGDGMLTALDIMSLHLHADLVILSACETALGSTGPGEGMIGMGWALSAAGASSSMLSLWKVDSAASSDFMIRFYSHYAARGATQSKAEALRQTGLDMLRSDRFRHPFYWAAFTLWGDPGHNDSGAIARVH